MMIALDLEASLIDNAIMGNPRPGLYEFIEFCFDNFDRVALLTTVEEADAREVLFKLADSGNVPEAFANAEYIDWEGEYKDLRFAKDVDPGEILFLDDDAGWVHPEQTDRWIPIQPWSSGDDTELKRVRLEILNRI